MARFPTTEWNHIATAGDREAPGADEAIAEICRRYWYPIYSFIRSRGHSSEASADLTQDYFARLLLGPLLARADRERGRFRRLLRTDCGFFLADQADRLRTRKRGGGVGASSLDAAAADHRYHLEPIDRLDPDHLFDRAWALDVLDRALDRLARGEAEAGRSEAFGHYREFLIPGPRGVSHALLALRLGATESAVEGALRRLRNRFRQVLRATVAETLRDPTEEDVDEEIRDLFAALSR